MQLHPENPEELGAEASYRAAFVRLKEGRPTVLAKGSPVSQNNIAVEAGSKAGAIKKSRFPSLVREIQEWLLANPPVATPSPRQEKLAQRKRNRSLLDRIAELEIQRDLAQSILVEADSKILDLMIENADLRRRLPEAEVRVFQGGPRETKS